jgi:glycosyltransferase involved in cell wall biosynthesis
MKILLSAFAFLPNQGSEPGVGWRWAIELVRADHQVVVLTDITRKAAIDKELQANPIPNLEVVCYRPTWLKFVPLNSKTAQILYSAWQYSLLPCARALHKKHGFDLIIHLTYGVFRHPSFLGFVGPKFVFGPVGGGEDAPWALKRSLPAKEKFKELLRSALNLVAKYNPFLNLALGRAALVLTKTEDTRSSLPKHVRSKAVVFPEIGIDPKTSATSVPRGRSPESTFEILFAGRLLGWKGVHLAIRAFAIVVAKGKPARLTIVGSGPLRSWLQSMAKVLGIEQHVRWIGQIPQNELFELYSQMHCFVFPSLHDSSGNVVLEALSFGLPVVCLDIGGPVTLVNSKCAVIINTQQADENTVTSDISKAILQLEENEQLRLSLANAAIKKAVEMTWASRTEGTLSLISNVPNL